MDLDSNNSKPIETTAEVSSTVQPTNQTTVANLKSHHKKAELKHPSNRNWLIHLHYVRREFNTCKQIIFEELLRLNGQSEYANYILALIYRSEGKMQESLDKLQVCHELEPTNANTVRQIARSLFLLGRHKLAIDAYQKAQMLNEDSDAETHYNMGMCFLFMMDLDKAKEHMNLSLQSRVTHKAFEAMAQIAIAKNSIQEAIGIYEKAVRVFPENAEVLSNLGVLYMKAGRDDIAFSRLGSAIAFDPWNPKATVAVASMLQTYDDYDQALAKYKVVMQTMPDSASVWNNVGMCFFGKRKYVASISCLKRAYYLSPFDWKILHNLGLLHLHMQQYASAFHFLTASINLKPDQSHTFMLLAVAISHLDDVEYAKHAYEQAIRLNIQNITTDPVNLVLNYAVSLFNHKKFSESHQKLVEVYNIIENGSGVIIEEDSKEIYHRVKTALKLMEFVFPDDNDQDVITSGAVAPPAATIPGAQPRKRVTTQQSVDQQAIGNLDPDLV
ncbi:unnamed protein product [Orchesella dallaii]|uniref:Bardet-Biedl syndrome 4 protein n=1 Tax=Orchesella dallaii TaxID=48710 RepID=A0ABP1PPN5_9HEXA